MGRGTRWMEFRGRCPRLSSFRGLCPRLHFLGGSAPSGRCAPIHPRSIWGKMKGRGRVRRAGRPAQRACGGGRGRSGPGRPGLALGGQRPCFQGADGMREGAGAPVRPVGFRHKIGDPGRTRTLNLLIRSQLLYPVELRDRCPDLSGKPGGLQRGPARRPPFHARSGRVQATIRMSSITTLSPKPPSPALTPPEVENTT